MTLFRTALVALAVLVTACKKGEDKKVEVDFRHNRAGGTPVATIGKDAITVEELNQRFAEMSQYARARYQTPEQKKDYVEGLARFELLATEAIRRGLHNDPDVVETAKKVMVQKLVQKEFDEKPSPVSDDEVKDYYEKHKSDYVKPEMVRLSHIFLAAPASDPEARKTKRAKAEELVKKAKALQPTDVAGFANLVREYSEEPRTKPLDGDMRFLAEADLRNQYGPEVAAAGTALKSPGEISDVVETERGFHILKFQARQPAVNQTLEDVKPQIQSRIIYERRSQNFTKFVEDLKKRENFKILEEALAKVQVDPKAPQQDPKGTSPGFIPPTPPPPRVPPAARPPPPPPPPPAPPPGAPAPGAATTPTPGK